MGAAPGAPSAATLLEMNFSESFCEGSIVLGSATAEAGGASHPSKRDDEEGDVTMASFDPRHPECYRVWGSLRQWPGK